MKYICQNCGAEWAESDIEDSRNCQDCGTLLIGVKTKFNHAFHVAFEVISEADDPDNVTIDEILVGLSQRLTNLVNNRSEVPEACEQYDVYEIDATCKFCERLIGKEGLKKAHTHQDELVCDNCWDERLDMTA